MTITRPKTPLKQLDGFIAAAPDSRGDVSTRTGLKTKRGRHRSQVSVVLPDAVLSQLDAEAERRYISRSALVTMLINQFLGDANS
jgi:hypothetical protein